MTFSIKDFTIGVEEEYQIVDPETRELKSHISAMMEEGDRVLGERHQIGAARQREQVAAIGSQRGGDDLVGVRAVGVENVVAPVGVEDGAVGFTVLAVCGFPVMRVQHREKIREKIDQHE